MFGLVEKAVKTNISIWCDWVEPHPEMKANSRLTFTTITGKDEMGEYQWRQFSSFVGSATARFISSLFTFSTFLTLSALSSSSSLTTFYSFHI